VRDSSLNLDQGVPVSAEENTRLVQRAYEAFGRGDIAALGEMMADDIEWVDPGDPDDDPNAGTFEGKEAVLGWFGGVASTLDYTTFEPREFIAQNDKVVSLVYSEATVRNTGRAFVNPEARVDVAGREARPVPELSRHRSGGWRPPRRVAPRGGSV
jgi:ketosteroid isomerase-like protein